MVKPYPVLSDKNTLYHAVEKKYSETDRVYTSAWMDGEGKRGQFLVNYNSTPSVCTVFLPEGCYTLTDDDGKVRSLAGGSHTLTLPPVSTVLIEG
jgi:hypothetical protein